MEQGSGLPAKDAAVIRDQNAYSGDRGSFGSRGSIKKNACGAIAAYNVSCLLGCMIPFDDVLETVIKNSRLIRVFGGRLGVWPGAVRRLLCDRGFQVTGFVPVRRAQAGHQAYIALYLHGSLFRRTLGAHYVALQPRDGKYAAYNDIYGSYEDFWDMYHKTKARRLWVMGIDRREAGGFA